jgi:uncharacterized protein YndB with AHSA1/START domain
MADPNPRGLPGVTGSPPGAAIVRRHHNRFAQEVVMALPDRIERTVTLNRGPREVWQALTTAEGLSAWFGERASIDLRPGGAATLTFAGGMTVDMRIERVEEPTVFAYTWRLPDLPEDDPRRTYVEFTLQPEGDGTLLRLVETGFAQLPVDTRRETYDSHSEGWTRELAELVEHVDAA